MKALTVNHNKKLTVIDLPKPKYNKNQALVKLVSCGICGTDQSLIEQKFKGFTEDNYPLVLGHEGVGRIVEVGSDVKHFEVGDIVLLPFNDKEGIAYDGIDYGWGAFAEYGVVNDFSVTEQFDFPEAVYAQQVIPNHIDTKEAAMLVTLREVYSAVNYFQIETDASVVIIGSGPVAQTFTKVMQLMGIQSIIAVVRNDKKEEIMYEYGATSVVNTSKENLKEKIKKQYPDGVDFVLDAVGTSTIVNDAMHLIKDRGEILCYGVPKSSQMNLDWSGAPYNWKLNFQQMPSKEEEGKSLQSILQWIEEGKINLTDFISDYYDFEEVVQAFKDYTEGKITKKAVIVFE